MSSSPSSTRSTPPQGPSAADTKMRPPADAGVVEKVASPLATLSSHVDPWPHYIMSAACAGGSFYSYSSAGNPRNAVIKAGFAATYLMAGRLLVTGDPKTGYDLGSIASLALTAWSWPRARAGDMMMTAMAALGGVSSAGNLVKSYEMRTGKPRELEMRHR